MRTSENSSDLERAPGARSIADEFFDPPILVSEIWGIEHAHFSQTWFTVWWHDPIGPLPTVWQVLASVWVVCGQLGWVV